MVEESSPKKKNPPTTTLKFIKLKCYQCSEVNLIPVFRTLYLFQIVKCNFCGAILMEFHQSEVTSG